MPSKLRKAIAAVKDQTSISLAKVSGTNCSNLDVAILKATTHEEVPVEDRYLNEVVFLTTSSHSYASACVQSLSRRITRTRNWIVAVKSLILIFRILQEGDTHFPKAAAHAMKHGMRLLNLSSFRDDSNSSPWDYTAFVRTFALYLDECLDCALMGKLHRSGNAHHHHHHLGRTVDHIRDMKPGVLLDKMAYWQRLLDRALATRPTGSAKTNRLVQIALYSIVRESFDLYREISDGLKFLLDNFFHLQHRSCTEAFHICTKATKQFDELANFYSLCKTLGIGWKSEYPSVQKISDQLLETLQEFLKDHQSSFQVGKPKEGQKLLALPPLSAKRSPGSQLSEESSSYQDCRADSEEEETEKASESSWGRPTTAECSPDENETNASAGSSSEEMGVEGKEDMNIRRVASDNSAILHLLPFNPDDRIPKSSSCMALFQEQQHQQRQDLPSNSSFDGVPGEWETVLAESANTISGPLDHSNKNAFNPAIIHGMHAAPSSSYSNHQGYSNPFLQGSESSFFFTEAYSSSTPTLPTFSAKGPEQALPPEADPFSSVYCISQSPAKVLWPPESPLTSAYRIAYPTPHSLSFDAADNRNFHFSAVGDTDATATPKPKD